MTTNMSKMPNLRPPQRPWGRLPRPKHGTTSQDGFGSSKSPGHINTNKHSTINFKREGRYDEEALKKLNRFVRDWRKDEEIAMDPHPNDHATSPDPPVHPPPDRPDRPLRRVTARPAPHNP